MELMQSSVTTHIYTIGFFFLIMLFNLYSVLTVKDFIKLAKRLKFMTPLYHVTNAIIIYSGVVVSFYAHYVNAKVLIMIPTAIFLMVIEIKRYKKMRIIKSDDIEQQQNFYKFAKKVYIIEICVLTCMFFITRAL